MKWRSTHLSFSAQDLHSVVFNWRPGTDSTVCHFPTMPIKGETSCSNNKFLSPALWWWWHLRICCFQMLKIYFTLTISARSSNPLAVVVKCWSKAKVAVVMLHSGPEGVLQATITAFLSMVLGHGLSPCLQSGCCCCRGSCVPAPDANKETPLLALTKTVYQHTLSTVDTLLICVCLRNLAATLALSLHLNCLMWVIKARCYLICSIRVGKKYELRWQSIQRDSY